MGWAWRMRCADRRGVARMRGIQLACMGQYACFQCVAVGCRDLRKQSPSETEDAEDGGGEGIGEREQPREAAAEPPRPLALASCVDSVVIGGSGRRAADVLEADHGRVGVCVFPQ